MMLKHTEADILKMLRERHTREGNGGSGEYAFMTHVRNAAGFNATRTFDAVAINLWPSKGLTIEIFEVKVSRSDWLRELKDPDKAGAALKLADYFSVVATAGIVKREELPEGWGLLEAGFEKLRRSVKPKRITPATRFFEPIPRGFVVGMMRSLPGAVQTPPRSMIREAVFS